GRLRTAAGRRRLPQGGRRRRRRSARGARRYPDNVAGGMGGMPPDEELFASAPHVVSEHIYQQMYVPVPMETRGMVAEWAAGTEELTVWASSQVPHELRAFAARLLGIPAHGVRVIVRDT